MASVECADAGCAEFLGDRGGCRPELPIDRPTGLGDHERSGMRLKELPAGRMVGVAAIGGREHHTGVDD